MQHILLPLLVLNLLLTFWLLRQHILRQGRRHQRREALAEWRNHVDIRLKQHFESLVNQSEIFLEHRSAMAEIIKDHYALNERLDGISVYDIKAILAGQERIQMLESDIEAIKDFISPYEARLSYFESVVNKSQAHDNFSGDDATISNLRNSHEMLAATVETLRMQHSGLACETDIRFVNHVRWLCSIEEWLARHTKFPLADDDVSLVFPDTLTKIGADILLVKNELDAIRSRVAGLEKAQISDADWQVLQRAYESIDREIKAAKESIATLDFMRKTYEDLDNRIVDLENGTKPFNPDTLIDSAKTTILLSDDDIIQDGDETTLSVGQVTYNWNLAGEGEIGVAVRDLRKVYGPSLHIRRKITTP